MRRRYSHAWRSSPMSISPLVIQRAQCPNHDPYQRPADFRERTTRLRGRSDQSNVVGPDRHWLSEPFVDADLLTRLIEAVQQLDSRRISDLMDLLAHVRPIAVFPAIHA